MGIAEAKSLALALGGLIHGHDFQETSGTTLDDFSASSLDSTLVAGRYTLNSTPLLPGATGSVLYGVTSGSVATRTVTSGPIQAMTSFTIVEVVQPNGYAVNRAIVERSNGWLMRQAANGQIIAQVHLGGAWQTQIQSSTIALANQPTMVAMTYDAGFLELGFNGAPDAMNPTAYAGALNTASTSSVTFGGSATMSGLNQLHLIFNRKLTYGELRDLAGTAGTAVDRVGGTYFDFTQDEHAIIASTPQTGYCHVTGGKMREGEAYRLPSGTTRRRVPVMRRIEALGRPTLSNSSTQEEWAGRAILHFLEATMHVSFQANASRKVRSEAGGKWYGPNGALATDVNYSGIGACAATIARYLAGGPRGRVGLISPDPFIQIARHSIQFLYNGGDGPLGGYWVGDDFATSQLAQMVVELEGLIPAAEHDALVEKFLRTIDLFWNGGTDLRGVAHGNEYNWYTNGNREVGEHLGFLPGVRYDPVKWTTRIEQHWTRILTPPSGLGAPPSPGFGWVETVTPTQANGSDGKGYLRENHGGNQGKGFWNWGSVGEAGEEEGRTKTGSYETIDVGGLSKQYVGLSTNYSSKALMLARHYGLPGEDRLERMTNMMLNKLMEYLNTSTWVVDGSYGSRGTRDFTFSVPFHQALTFAGYRSDFNGLDWAAQWEASERVTREKYRIPDSTNFWRDMPWRIGLLLQSLDAYSGA